METKQSDLEKLVAEIVSSYVGNNQVASADLPTVITTVYDSLKFLGKTPEPEPVRAPAVPIGRSVHHDFVVCLDCGRRAKTLRRHISAIHDLTPDEYRARWNLQPGHPVTAPGYSAQRSAFAKQVGLGQRLGRNRDVANLLEPSSE